MINYSLHVMVQQASADKISGIDKPDEFIKNATTESETGEHTSENRHKFL